jgi:hypothetical protein
LELRRHSQLLPKIDKEIQPEDKNGIKSVKLGSLERLGL